ncbi:hypothetical protein BCh11DRAFT_01756 [Burkholderia sp. Ch1-1]|nr:hypothetical protein BCh11DRAFT_01756 [Burkholderia sp. Ch1-1]
MKKTGLTQVKPAAIPATHHVACFGCFVPWITNMNRSEKAMWPRGPAQGMP